MPSRRRRVPRGPALGRLIRPYVVGVPSIETHIEQQDSSTQINQDNQIGALYDEGDQTGLQDEQYSDEFSHSSEQSHSELAYEDGRIYNSQHTIPSIQFPHHSIYILTCLCSGFDAIEAHQYLHEIEDELDDELDEHTFNLDEIRHAIDYNDLVDELGPLYREQSAIIDDLPTGYFEDDDQEEDDIVGDSDFHVSGAYPDSDSAHISQTSLSSSEEPDHTDQSEPVFHECLTGMPCTDHSSLTTVH